MFVQQVLPNLIVVTSVRTCQRAPTKSFYWQLPFAFTLRHLPFLMTCFFYWKPFLFFSSHTFLSKSKTYFKLFAPEQTGT